MHRQPLTIAVMARNEDWFVENTIRSALEASDDVLVGDMESSDQTVDIAKRLGARVMTVPISLMVEEGWAACRNYMNAQAKHDWVLTLDADEVLSRQAIGVLGAQEWAWDTPFVLTPTRTYRAGVGMSLEQARATNSVVFPHRRMFNRTKVEWRGIIHEEPHHIGGFNVGAAPDYGIVREHFTNCRPKTVTSWKWQVDAQLLLRAVSGHLPKDGVNSWWMNAYIPNNKAKLVKWAKTFFASNPAYQYLVAGIKEDMGLGFQPRTAVTPDQHNEILKMAATTQGPMAELGVDWGLTTVALARRFPERQLYAVDMWDEGHHKTFLPDGTKVAYKLPFVRGILGPLSNVQIVVSDIPTLASKWDKPVGFIFSDADHTEAGVLRDLQAWVPHLAPGGLIIVHDSNRAAVSSACKKVFKNPSFRLDMCLWRRP